MTLERICIELARPRGDNYPGKVAEAHYVVENDTVLLTDKNGVPVDRYRFARTLRPGESAKAVACILLRLRHQATKGSFNRSISYPRMVY